MQSLYNYKEEPCEFMDRELLRKVIINYLHYNLKKTVDDAVKLFDENAAAFYQVFDVLGEDFISKVFKQIDSKDTRHTGKRNG